MDAIEDLFGDMNITVTKIDVDEDAEYKKYALSLYEKLKLRNGPDLNTLIADLAAEKTEREKTLTCLTYSVDNVDACFDIGEDQIELTYTVKLGDENLALVLPKQKYAEEIVNRGMSYLRYIRDRILELSSDLIIKRLYASNNISAMRDTKLPIVWSPIQIQAMRMQAQIILDERYLRSELAKFASSVSKEKYKRDPIAGGVWRISGTKIANTTPIIMMEDRLRLNSSSVDSLCTIAFSSKEGVIARAKMDLNNKLQKTTFAVVIKDSELALAMALAETMLTPLEALTSVFKLNKDNENFTCYACGTAVAPKRRTYHPKCKVVKWLLQYYPFEYNKEEQLLSIMSAIYISPKTRQRISHILELHNKLNNDIVVSNQNKKIVWSRQGDGTLQKKVYETDGYVDQIGSHNWRVQAGLSPERKSRMKQINKSSKEQ